MVLLKDLNAGFRIKEGSKYNSNNNYNNNSIVGKMLLPRLFCLSSRFSVLNV